jgi:hypothetical protein
VLLVLREGLQPAGPSDGLGGPGPLAVLGSLAGKRRSRQADGQVNAGARRAAESRLVRRLGEAIELLSPAGIVVTPLDAGQATAVLASACNPDSLLPPSPGLAGADEVITTSSSSDLTDDFAGDTDDLDNPASAFVPRSRTPASGQYGSGDLRDDLAGDVGDDWDYENDYADYDEDERGRF